MQLKLANPDRVFMARGRDQLVQQLIEANNIQAPPSLVGRMLHGLMHAYGIPHEREEQFAAEFRPIAIRQVQRELLLTAVAKEHALHATEAEIDQRIARIAESRGTSPKEAYSSLWQSKRLPELERSITEEKVFDFLLGQSTVRSGS